MQLLDLLQEHGKHEIKLAVAEGRIDSAGIAFTEVIVDGCWSHRSYGHRYSSLSGAACIISSKTKNLLYLGVKNKFCLQCCMNAKTGKEKWHDCFKNHRGSSTSMEADIVRQGFQYYESLGLRFYTIIADDDSSVYKKIKQCVPYGGLIEKKLCVNHVLRNFTARLYKIQSNLNRCAKSKLNGNLIQSIKQFARRCISRYRDTELAVSKLEKQLEVIPDHAIGNHENCIQEFCQGGTLTNDLPNEILIEVRYASSILSSKSSKIASNETSNLAENLMGQIGRLSGGKIYNRNLRGRYQFDCMMAGLQFNNKSEWARRCFEKTFNYQLSSVACKYTRVLASKVFKKRDSVYQCTHNARRAMRRKHVGAPDENYGNVTSDPSPPEDPIELEKKCEAYMNSLIIDSAKQNEIETSTKAQSNSLLWREERCKRLTASNFGKICKMKNNTPCSKTVIQIVYNTQIKCKAIEYGKSHENHAIKEFEKHTNFIVQSSGLWIDLETFYLAASPDGLIGNDALLEVKCPFSLRHIDPILANTQAGYYDIINVQTRQIKLHKTHNYYYQVQGQLHITKRPTCYFFVWSVHGIGLDVIKRDDKFWEKNMIPKLSSFYKKCMLPELAKPRHSLGFAVREFPR